MIEIKALSIGYEEKPIISNINFLFNKGVLALVGKNGCGKTTFFRTVSGVLAPIQGEIFVNNIVLNDTSPIRDEVAYLTHKPVLFEKITVLDNLKYWCEFFGLNTKLRIDYVTQLLNIERLLNRLPSTLSRGEAQSVSLARCLLTDPKIILLDEPTTGLDHISKNKLLKLITDNLSQDKTIVYSSHNIEEVQNIADSIVILKDGEVSYSGTLTNIAGIDQRVNFEISIGCTFNPSDLYEFQNLHYADNKIRGSLSNEEEFNVLISHLIAKKYVILEINRSFDKTEKILDYMGARESSI